MADEPLKVSQEELQFRIAEMDYEIALLESDVAHKKQEQAKFMKVIAEATLRNKNQASIVTPVSEPPNKNSKTGSKKSGDKKL